MPVAIVKVLDSADYPPQVRRAAELLAEGKIVVLPTETVYGAAVLLGSAAGRQRLAALRHHQKPTPITPHLADQKQAELFLGPISRLAARMMQKLWPGPVGLQFEVESSRRSQAAASLGIGETELYQEGWITLRCPDHPVFAEVATAAAGPLAAAAAGEPGRFDAGELARDLDGKAELLFDAGPPRFSKPSTLVKINGSGYQVVRAGVYDERTIRRLLKTTILFVCSGNTCRSPMAEAIARKILTDRLGELDKQGIEVLSAGSMAMPGFRATPEASDAVKALGADLSRHRSRPLTIELVNQADLIYTMSRDHRRAVMSLVPSAENKVQMLDPEKDVDDPIGSDAAVYNQLAGELRYLIDARLAERPLP